MADQEIKFQWLNAIKGKNGPESSTTRYMLLMLSTHMNTDGRSCFPSTATLADETQLSERAVCTHLFKAEQGGWIEKRPLGTKGKGWRRHEYKPLIPIKALNNVQQEAIEGTEPRSEGTEPRSIKALNDVQSSSSYTSSSKSSSLYLSELLLNLILERRNSFKRPDLKKWERHVDLMIRKDERSICEIEEVIRWCQQDSFWQNNILSTQKLREQFDQLYMKSKAQEKNLHEKILKTGQAWLEKTA